MRTPGSRSSWTIAPARRWHGALGDADPEGYVGYSAARLIDGLGGPPIERALVRTDGTSITYAGPASGDPNPGAGPILDLGDRTLMPGLIDCHAHPVFHSQVVPTSDSFGSVESEPQAAWSGELRVLESAAASWRALARDITTIRVPGLPGVTSFALRDAIQQGVIQGPRLVIAGRVICPTGGHGHAGGEEADGPVGVRRAARLMFKSGADFLKLTATGGGTARTARDRGTFTVEELAAAAQEAEQHNSYATAHVHGTEGIVRCLDAGIQMLEHATFVGPDGWEHFDRAIADRMRDQDVVVVPTVQVYGHEAALPDREGFLAGFPPAERKTWARRLESFRRRLELVSQLHEAGVVLLMGSDGGGRPAPIDDLPFGLELHVRAGINPMEVILSATSTAASRIGIGAVTGSLQAGRAADMIAVPGDPLTDMSVVRRADFVLANGSLIRMPEGMPAVQVA